MRFALVNPDWTFQGSTYFGCQEPHYPHELLFAFDQVHAAGHEALLVDAQSELSTTACGQSCLRPGGGGTPSGLRTYDCRDLLCPVARPTRPW